MLRTDSRTRDKEASETSNDPAIPRHRMGLRLRSEGMTCVGASPKEPRVDRIPFSIRGEGVGVPSLYECKK